MLIQDAFSAGEEEKRFAHGVLLVVPDRRIGSKSRQFYCWREVLQGRSCMQKKSSVILHLIVAAWAQSVPQSQMNPPKRAEISMWEASRGQLMSHEQSGNWPSNDGLRCCYCLDHPASAQLLQPRLNPPHARICPLPLLLVPQDSPPTQASICLRFTASGLLSGGGGANLWPS